MKRTGKSKIAVVGWGRGMGHTGHMYLADAVITQAADMKADPYFFVSKTVGKEDPLFPEEKLSIYQTVFPQQKNIFTAEGNLNQALQELVNLGYQGVVLVVGADQKESFKYLENPNKEGVPVYQSLGLKKLKVISRQETRSKFRGEEGPRATPMREILLNPDATDEQKYEVWRRDMPSALSDDQVMDLMTKAATRLAAPKKRKTSVKSLSAKAKKIKEALINFRTSNPVQKKTEPMGYKQLFKEPTTNTKPNEKRFMGWQEYLTAKEKGEIEEARIMGPDAKVNLYYVTRSGQRQIVFQSIPQRMLEKAVMVLKSKYPQIKDTDIEMRPVDVSQYRKTSDPELAEGTEQNLSIQQLATISDEALDNAYHYGRSTPGNSFGWQANLKSAAYAKQMIDKGVTDIEAISDAIHKGWNVTAQAFVQNPDQFDDTEKLRQAGKLDAKLQQRAKLMKINYAQLDNEEQEKDRVVARALLQAIRGEHGVEESGITQPKTIDEDYLDE